LNSATVWANGCSSVPYANKFRRRGSDAAANFLDERKFRRDVDFDESRVDPMSLCSNEVIREEAEEETSWLPLFEKEFRRTRNRVWFTTNRIASPRLLRNIVVPNC
jgi:hypothetical protein